MPSWLKGKSASKSKSYDNVGKSNEDPFSDVGYYDSGGTQTETYTGGIAPVVIEVDETDGFQPKRSWKDRKPMSMFVDKEGEEASKEKADKKIGNGDLAGTKSDLDMCCLQDGTLGCLGFDNIVLFSGEGDQYKKIDNSHRSTSNSDDIERIQNLCPVKSVDESTIETDTQELERIRSMGAIRDKKESKSVSYYLSQCAPKSSSEKGTLSFIKRRFRLVLVMILLFLLALVAGIVAVALQRQKNNKPYNAKDLLVTIVDVRREAEIKSLLDLTSPSVWETEGSPQIRAMKWLVDEDPLAQSLEDEEQIKERFAAATLYFATNGPETWKSSLGFLGDNSICDWNIDGIEESIGIYCENERVNEINIVSNNLSGSLTNELNYFSEVVVLNLFFNKLTGSIPDLSSLVKLEQLDLDDNELSGTVPESIFNLPSLVNLFFLFNKGLTGKIPEINDSSKLVAVSLLGCSFSGTLPKSLGNLSSLRLLQLKDNKIEGTIPLKLLSSSSLETLGLDGNRLTGSIPPVIVNENGTILKSLSLSSNKLEGSLPFGLDDLTTLQYLYADDNMLTGSIRSAIMGLPKLEQLWLMDNSLSGDISYFLSESNVLSEVYLGGNDFSGDLHDFLAFAPPSLERLDVSGNRGIDGYISEEIGNFGSMKYFNVSACSLGGRIPTEIGRLKKLETLDLSWNDFQGDVPEEMANMVSLVTFDISRNRDLGGDFSSSICKERNDLVFALADCSGDVRVDCDCCTHCCNREGVCGPNNN